MNQEEVVAQHTWKELIHLTFEVLNYPLFDLDGHPVSLGKLITGVVLLILGYWFSRRASSEVDRRVLTRLSMDESLRYTLRRFIFYIFVCITTLFTLHALAVPVTIFTVIGGALAAGIGFGSQNLVNNFISGVLVMVERPIRVGDFIEVGGVTGQVESIGIRSTIVRAGFNAVTVIPNTVFIEKNLTNWTMSGVIVSKLRVGVAYGTDTEKFKSLCLKVVTEEGRVLSEPAPGVVFEDFGDSALIFDISYFTHSRDFPNRKSIESNIRFKLNDIFVQNQINLPFPQRDVRLVQGPELSVSKRETELRS